MWLIGAICAPIDIPCGEECSLDVLLLIDKGLQIQNIAIARNKIAAARTRNQ